MFTQKISMDCTKEQYEKYLKDELLKMGYKVGDFSEWFGDNNYITNYYNRNGYIGNINKVGIDKDNRLYLGKFNAPLFLALAAMTDNPIGIDEEYYTNGRNRFIRKSELILQMGKQCPMDYLLTLPLKAGFIGRVFRKATKEEIMANFSKTEPDTNYDAAREFVKDFCDKANNLKVVAICDNIHQSTKKAIEQENAIKLLRENGYKILKPKTWEEV